MSNTTNLLTEHIVDLGFRKRTGHVYTLALAEGVQGWLGLNQGTAHQPKGHVAINPVVGVRHDRLEAIVAELEERRGSLTPTISSSLGYLLPERRAVHWLITPDADLTVIRHFVESLRNAAIPFMQTHKELPAILEAMRENLGFRLEYRIPVALMLLGEASAAHRELDRALAEIEERRDPAATSFRRFAGRLVERLQNQQTSM